MKAQWDALSAEEKAEHKKILEKFMAERKAFHEMDGDEADKKAAAEELKKYHEEHKDVLDLMKAVKYLENQQRMEELREKWETMSEEDRAAYKVIMEKFMGDRKALHQM